MVRFKVVSQPILCEVRIVPKWDGMPVELT